MGDWTTSRWTETEDNLLRVLWSSSRAAKEIGNEMGRTKNAVIGRMHRIGLGDRPGVVNRPKRDPSQPKPVGRPRMPVALHYIKPQPALSIEPQPSMPQDSPTEAQGRSQTAVSILDAKPHHCRAVVGSSDDPNGLAMFCGEQVVGETSWCKKHLAEYTYSIRR